MSYIVKNISDNYKRLMWGIIADSRANIPVVKDAIGDDIKAYVDSQTALVVPGVLPYAVWTDQGNLAAYFLLQVSAGPVEIIAQQLRPAFVQYSIAISQNIANFITSGQFMFDLIN